MTDRELLEMAAKAAGYGESRTCIDEWFWVLTDDGDWHSWNPLTDDGDALRLAVKLGLDIDRTAKGWVTVRDVETCVSGPSVALGDDHYAATCRAIVMAAAEIGKILQQNQ
jgi:hypothetical protein